MPVPGLGHRSYIQIAKQSAYDTFVQPTADARGVKLEIINWRVEPVIGVIRDPSLYNAVTRRAIYQGGRSVRGTFTVRCNYEGLEELYRSAMADYSQGLVGGSADQVRDHVFALGSTLGMLSIECVWGDIPQGKCFRLTGCKMVGMTIRGTAGQGNDAMLTVEFTVLAKNMTSNHDFTDPEVAVSTASPATMAANGVITRVGGSFTGDGFKTGMVLSGDLDQIPDGATVITPGTTSMTISQQGPLGALDALEGTAPQFPGLYPVIFDKQVIANIKDGTTDDPATLVRIRSFEVTIESPHTEDRFYLGALDMDEPFLTDFVTVRWRLTQEFITKSQFDNAMSLSVVSARLFFRHAFDMTGGPHYRELEMFSNNANIVEWSAPIEGFGAVLSTATIEGQHHVGDNSAFVLRTRNGRPALA